MWSKKAISQLDKFYPPCGPCAFCGFKDKRHRLWDSWLCLKNEGAEWIAIAYEVDIEYVRLVLELKPYHRNNF